jgi:hypothetical protein
MIISLKLTFLLSKFSGLQRKTPSAPSPHRAVQGVGEKWIFSSTCRNFGYGYEAVRVRVKILAAWVNFKKNALTKLQEFSQYGVLCPFFFSFHCKRTSSFKIAVYLYSNPLTALVKIIKYSR